MVNRLLVAIFCIPLLVPGSAFAQRSIGVDWQVPDEPSEAAADLQYFSELGISHLQIDRSLDSQIWQQINRLQFEVYGKLPVNFAVAQSFSASDSSFTSRLISLAAHYKQQSSVNAIGIFAVGAEYDDQFRSTVSSFVKGIATERGKQFYYITADAEWPTLEAPFSFRMIQAGQSAPPLNLQTSGYMYHPAPKEEWDLAAVKSFLEQTAGNPNAPVFFRSAWLKNMTEKYPDLDGIINLYATSTNPVFPLPRKETDDLDSKTIIVVMLLLAWLIFGAVYSYNPVYRRSFMRYFTGHTFFVDDVMQRHIRTMFTGVSILIQHAIAGGIVLYCLFHVLFAPLGYEALYTHYPILAAFGTGAFGLFVWGFLFTSFIEIINVIWLWAANPATQYVSQIMNLYPWLLQLNLITATLIAAFYLAGENQIPIYLLTAVFVFFFVGSFIITAFDTARQVNKKRIWVYAGTVGGYSLLLIGLMIWAALSPKLLNVVELAARLP